MSTDAEREEILSRFPPREVDDGQSLAIGDIRMQCQTLAMVILDRVPRGRQRSLAITHLEDVAHWAVKGISHANRGEETITS